MPMAAMPAWWALAVFIPAARALHAASAKACARGWSKAWSMWAIENQAQYWLRSGSTKVGGTDIDCAAILAASLTSLPAPKARTAPWAAAWHAGMAAPPRLAQTNHSAYERSSGVAPSLDLPIFASTALWGTTSHAAVDLATGAAAGAGTAAGAGDAGGAAGAGGAASGALCITAVDGAQAGIGGATAFGATGSAGFAASGFCGAHDGMAAGAAVVGATT
jgi:hypothetical protein